MPATPDRRAAQRDRAAALALIAESAVMTLAVTATDGPWAAPVYYAYRPDDAGFYFFSSPQSRHIEAAMEVGACAAAIFRPANTSEGNPWESICGLQMRGELTTAGVAHGPKALALYLKKFPFSRSLLPSGKSSLEIFQHHLGVRLYRFSATRIEWTDNRVRFGYRSEIPLR